MNFNIVNGADGVAEYDWGQPTDIFPLIFNSINIKKGSLFTAPYFGLDLSDIRKVTDSKIPVIKKRISTALYWLIETNKARAIKVDVQRNNLVYGRVDIAIEVIQADSVPISIDTFIVVGL